MKKRNVKKLSLNKETVVNLEKRGMKNILGGGTELCTVMCTVTCMQPLCGPTTTCTEINCPTDLTCDTCW